MRENAAWDQAAPPQAAPPAKPAGAGGADHDDDSFCEWLYEEALDLFADVFGAASVGPAEFHLNKSAKDKFKGVSPAAKKNAKAKAKAAGAPKKKAVVAPVPLSFEGHAAPGVAPAQGRSAPGARYRDEYEDSGYRDDPYPQDSGPYYDDDGAYPEDGAGTLRKEAEAAASTAEEQPDDTKSNNTEGLSLDDLVEFAQGYPLFCITWCLLVFLLWLVYSVRDGTEIAGFESIWPGETTLTVYSECEDYRSQIWRWWSYQFTHTSFTHVFTNVLLVLVLGIQLEGYHGTLTLWLFFQIGVFGGAMCYLVSDCHTSTVGMSGGCYSLIGMHIGDITLNWQERPRRWAKLLLIAFFFAFDTLQTYVLSSSDSVSHSAHTGGFVAGCVICVIFGHNSKVHTYERVIQLLSALVGIACISFCLGWGLQWPPQTVFEDVGWCWTRQVMSKTYFGDWDVRCVRCDNQDCIATWSQEEYIATVTVAACESLGGWAVTER